MKHGQLTVSPPRKAYALRLKVAQPCPIAGPLRRHSCSSNWRRGRSRARGRNSDTWTQRRAHRWRAHACASSSTTARGRDAQIAIWSPRLYVWQALDGARKVPGKARIGGDYPAIRLPLLPSGLDCLGSASDLGRTAMLAGRGGHSSRLPAATTAITAPPVPRTVLSSAKPSQEFLDRREGPTLEGMEADGSAALPGRATSCEETLANAFFAGAGEIRDHPRTTATGYSIGPVLPAPDWGEADHELAARRPHPSCRAQGMAFHFMSGLWLDTMGLEITESLLYYRGTAHECLGQRATPALSQGLAPRHEARGTLPARIVNPKKSLCEHDRAGISGGTFADRGKSGQQPLNTDGEEPHSWPPWWAGSCTRALAGGATAAVPGRRTASRGQAPCRRQQRLAPPAGTTPSFLCHLRQRSRCMDPCPLRHERSSLALLRRLALAAPLGQ